MQNLNFQEAQQILKQFDTLISQLPEIKKIFDIYIDFLNDGGMVINNQGTIEDKIQSCDNVIDKMKEVLQKKKELKENCHKAMEMIGEMQNTMSKIILWGGSEEEIENFHDNIIHQKIEYITEKHEKDLKDLENSLIRKTNPKYSDFLKREEIKHLETWTGLKCGDVLFDSDIDDWNKKTSVFSERISGKKQFILVVEDTLKNKFGYYLNTEVEKNKFQRDIKTDDKSFVFSLVSNERLPGPMKFEIKNTDKGYYLSDNHQDYLINCGDFEIVLSKKGTLFSTPSIAANNFCIFSLFSRGISFFILFPPIIKYM